MVPVALRAQEEMPDTTNLELMFDSINVQPNNELKYGNYQWLLNKVQREDPQNWSLCCRVYHNMGTMQLQVGATEQAFELFKKSLAISSEHVRQGDVKALYYDAATRITLTGIYKDDEQMEQLIKEVELSLKEFDEYAQKADASDPETNYLEDIPIARMAGNMSLCFAYQRVHQYEKSMEAGLRSVECWEALTDVEDKNGTLYFRYMAGAELCRCAQKVGKVDVFREEVKDLEAFLSDVFTKLNKRELKADAETRNTLSGMCGMLMEPYANLGEADRCKELALLGVRFFPKNKSITNYELCRSLIKCNQVAEAKHIYDEMMKDEEFIKEYKIKESDPVGEMLKMVAKASEYDAKSTVATSTTAGGAGDMSGLSSILQHDLASSPARRGTRIVLEGYTAQNMVPYREKNGRVVLPIDKREVKGFGVSVKW